MATLHVRNIPERLYKRIRKLAEEESRSLTAEVIQILDHGLRAREARRGVAAIIERIRLHARKVELPRDWVESTELIRKDRSR